MKRQRTGGRARKVKGELISLWSTGSDPGADRLNDLPLKADLRSSYVSSVLIAVLIAVVSGAGILLTPTGLYGSDPKAAVVVTPSSAGVLVPGFLAHDAFNALVAFPALLGLLWLVRRGSLAALLLWPGMLFYGLYTYSIYLMSSPFGVLFLPYAALVGLTGYTSIALVSTIDGARVRQYLIRAVPVRAVGGLLIALSLLTLGQDALGAVGTAVAGTLVDPMARPVWAVDLAVEIPALLIAGVLLWRRQALGYVVAAGLLFQFGLTPFALALIMGAQPVLAGSTADLATIVGLLTFSAVAWLPLVRFIHTPSIQSPISYPQGRRYS